MSKYNRLKKNIVVFTIGSFGTKIINIILLPYYTKVFSAGEYGIVELLLTVAGLAIPIISLSINDAALRFSIDEIDSRSSILSTGIVVVSIGFCFSLPAACLLYTVVRIELIIFFYCYILLTMIYNLLGYFAKGIGYTEVYAKSGILYTLTFSLLNIVFISFYDLGIRGYFFALFLSTSICIIYLFLKCDCKRYISIKIDLVMAKRMLKYSLPLVPNNISWWVSNSSDKLLLNTYGDIADVGIYSVAYKIPNACNSIASVFLSAWHISSVETLNDSDKIDFYNKVYNIYFYISIFFTSIVAIGSKIISTLLFDYEFQDAWMCIPWLIASVFFSNMAAFYGGIMTANKYTGSIFISTVICALTNIVLNIVFIPSFGTVGAALATCICYILLFFIRNLTIKLKIKYVSNNYIHYICMILLIAQVLFYIRYISISIVCAGGLLTICTINIIKGGFWKVVIHRKNS